MLRDWQSGADKNSHRGRSQPFFTEKEEHRSEWVNQALTLLSFHKLFVCLLLQHHFLVLTCKLLDSINTQKCQTYGFGIIHYRTFTILAPSPFDALVGNVTQLWCSNIIYTAFPTAPLVRASEHMGTAPSTNSSLTHVLTLVVYVFLNFHLKLI